MSPVFPGYSTDNLLCTHPDPGNISPCSSSHGPHSHSFISHVLFQFRYPSVMPKASLKFSFSYKPRSSTEPSRPPLSHRWTGLDQIVEEPRNTTNNQKSIEEIGKPETNISEAAKRCRKFQLASLIQMFLGLFVMVLNIIFIYFGLKGKWYISFLGQDSRLNVISIGEGIIAGFLYIIINLLSPYLGNRDHFKKALFILHFLLITISTSLTLANACQIGLVQMFSPRHLQYEDNKTRQVEMEMSLAETDRIAQIVILALEMVANYSVLMVAVVEGF